MQEIRTVTVNRREIPVLISDEKEALLAAKTAGRAIVGLWRPGQEMEEISAARYVVENLADVTEEFLDRVARRHLGLPWHICETERLVIREMFADDFDEVWTNQIGLGLNSVEELQAYTKNQYVFYEFGIWALVEKESGELVGVAGLKVPEEVESDHVDELVLDVGMGRETLELGYHIFSRFRRKGYAKEACEAVIRYGVCELEVGQFLVRIDKENIVSKRLAEGLGFFAGN